MNETLKIEAYFIEFPLQLQLFIEVSPHLKIRNTVPPSFHRLSPSTLLLCMCVFPWQSHANTALKVASEGNLLTARGDETINRCLLTQPLKYGCRQAGCIVLWMEADGPPQDLLKDFFMFKLSHALSIRHLTLFHLLLP